MNAGGAPDTLVPNPAVLSVLCSRSQTGSHFVMAALTGAGERGHRYNTEDPMVRVFMGRPPKPGSPLWRGLGLSVDVVALGGTNIDRVCTKKVYR